MISACASRKPGAKLNVPLSPFSRFQFSPLNEINVISINSVFTRNFCCCAVVRFLRQDHVGSKLKLPLKQDSFTLLSVVLPTCTLLQVLPTVRPTTRWLLTIISCTFQSFQC